MNTLTKTIIAAVGAVLFTAAPCIASAERIYFLVGTRHIYRIGPYQYDHLAERQKIEEDYADQVAGDQDTYNKAIAGGADPATEGPQLSQALDDLALERDKRLGAIFENADYERDRHPQLRIEGDGPYQVIGINFHYNANVEVFDDFVVYAPWPGYVVVDRPYGWSYGVVYTPGIFFGLYTGWYSSVFIGGGGPAFFGFYGHHGGYGYLGIDRGSHGGYTFGNGGRGGLGRVLGTGGYSHSSTGRTFGSSRSTTGGLLGGSRYNSGHSFGTSRYSTGGLLGGGSRYNSGHSFGTSHSTTGGLLGGASRYNSGRTTGTTSHSTFGSTTRSGFGTSRTGSSYSHGMSGTSSHSSFGTGRSSSTFGRSSSSSYGRSFGSSRTSSAPRPSSSGRSSSSYGHGSSSSSHSSFGGSRSSGPSSSHISSPSHSSGGGSRKKG